MKKIPMLDLRAEYKYMQDDIDAAIKSCLEHQKWILGPEVKTLEDKVSAYLNVKHCVGVSSGTDALVLSLRALAIKLKGQEYFNKSDEIITTPFTFTATGDAILRAGATPVFVDIDPTTYNIDPNKIREYLKYEASQVVGVVPVYLYGQSCQMDEILKIAEEYNLFIVEDVAQAFGGVWKDRKLGSIGITGCFSFFPSKNLGGFGDGGMISTNDDKIRDLVRMLLKHGGKDKYNIDHIGYNARLDTLQAAILLAKFKYVDEFNLKRREIAMKYNEGLKDIRVLVLPVKDSHHVYHQYTIRVKNELRNALQRGLKDRGIDTMVYYPIPLHKMGVFADKSKVFGELEYAEGLPSEILSLPIEPLQDDEQTDFIIKTVIGFFE